jgi:long-chain acyl-CoA synthetase
LTSVGDAKKNGRMSHSDELAAKIAEAKRFRTRLDFTVDFTSPPHALETHAARTPDAPYLIAYDAAGRRETLSYGEFLARVTRGAALLTALGVRRGDRVATFAHNHVETVVAYFAVWRVGACLVPVNMTEDDRRRRFILENSDARVILALAEHAAAALSAADEIPGGARVVQLTGEPLPGARAWRSAHETETPAADAPDFSDEALIVYTSGTTGAPKGVVLTHANILYDAHALREWNRLKPADRLMCVLPIHHVNGMIVTLVTPLYAGCATVLNAKFSPAHFWERIAAERVRIVSVVPTLLAFLLDAPALRDGHDVSSLSHVICGAGPLTVEVAQRFEETFDLRILHGYGLSETTCYSSMLPLDLSPEAHRRRMRDFGFPSIGVAIAGCEMAIHDPDGRPLPPGARGEIVICGPTVMEGYFNRPDANAEAFAHGWFRSGDEGFFERDETGREFFFITGRIKELIIRGGVNLSPFEIDEALGRIPGVRCGLAVGFENHWYGEEVGAYVVPEDGAALDAETILAAVRAELPFHKTPKIVVFGTEIPVTSTGKYQRNKLKPFFAAWKETQFKP